MSLFHKKLTSLCNARRPQQQQPSSVDSISEKQINCEGEGNSNDDGNSSVVVIEDLLNLLYFDSLFDGNRRIS